MKIEGLNHVTIASRTWTKRWNGSLVYRERNVTTSLDRQISVPGSWASAICWVLITV